MMYFLDHIPFIQQHMITFVFPSTCHGIWNSMLPLLLLCAAPHQFGLCFPSFMMISSFFINSSRTSAVGNLTVILLSSHLSPCIDTITSFHVAFLYCYLWSLLATRAWSLSPCISQCSARETDPPGEYAKRFIVRNWLP